MFALTVVAFYQSIIAQVWHTAWSLPPLGLFILSVLAHRRNTARLDQQRRIANYYADGLERLQGRWQTQGVTGDCWLTPDHCYALDLNIFGQNSLFQLLCQARTRLGEACLAEWLTAPATIEEIAQRQDAIRELAPKLDSREALAVVGDAAQLTNRNHQNLSQWAQNQPAPLPPLARALAFLLPALSLGGIIACALGAGTIILTITVILVLAQLALLRSQYSIITALSVQLDRLEAGLGTLSGVLLCLENESFDCSRLQNIRAALNSEGEPPSVRIRQLGTLINVINSSLRNQFILPVAILFCLPIHCVYAIQRWQKKVASHIPGWLQAVAEYEALSSLAGYTCEHPDDPFPKIVDTDFHFEATQIGHPLIAEPECVRNDLSMTDGLRLVMVSGSNMSGKSTLLRTLGVNIVLALAGAPVRARSLSLSVFRVGTVMQVHDSLAEGASYFFAVISRLKSIVTMAGESPPLFFLLDEILQGTNSHDRHLGAEAILQQLIKQQAMGLVTTHDLALTHIVDKLQGKAINIHFEDQWLDDQMQFDYRIRPGVVTRSNAMALMRMVGLTPADITGA